MSSRFAPIRNYRKGLESRSYTDQAISQTWLTTQAKIKFIPARG